MKYIFILLLIIFISNSYSQNEAFNKLSVEASLGGTNAVKPFSDGYWSNTIDFFHTDAACRYMFNNKIGAKIDLGYDVIKNDALGKNGNSLPFSSNYYRTSINGIINIGRLARFENFTNRISLLANTGVGVSLLTSDLNPNSNVILNSVFGVSPQYLINDRIALYWQTNFIFHIYQKYTFDMLNNHYQRGFDGFIFNSSLGVNLYIGKRNKHLDWVNTACFPDLRSEIKDKDSLISSLKYKLADSDGDGVINIVDHEQNTEIGEKVDARGVSLKNLDSDGDGVADLIDKCMNLFGLKENEGCPELDTDKDGVLDDKDKCPLVFGLIENNGCPVLDIDEDGVYDDIDECPNTPGPIENKGCPVIEDDVVEVLKTAFENLEFESGSNNLKESSYPSLNELAIVLQNKKNWNLEISGHTDNTGDALKNLIISKKRAESIKQYLFVKGIEENRIRVLYFGETMPIASNDTEEGRQRNRRVELKIVFD
jgi:outer membrane protein OmpA-like peptidoglycan-associated protein